MRLRQGMIILYHGRLYKMRYVKGVLHAVRLKEKIHIADIKDDYTVFENGVVEW